MYSIVLSLGIHYPVSTPPPSDPTSQWSPPLSHPCKNLLIYGYNKVNCTRIGSFSPCSEKEIKNIFVWFRDEFPVYQNLPTICRFLPIRRWYSLLNEMLVNLNNCLYFQRTLYECIYKCNSISNNKLRYKIMVSSLTLQNNFNLTVTKYYQSSGNKATQKQTS